METNNFVATEF